MAEQKSSAFCKGCNAQRLVVRPGVNHVLHAILSICTFGAWLIVWALLSLRAGDWRCSVCGRKVLTGIDRLVEDGGAAIAAACSRAWKKYVAKAPAKASAAPVTSNFDHLG